MKKCDIRFKVENDLTTIGAVDESNNIQDITAVTEYKNQFDKEARFFYNYKKEVFAFDGYQLKFNESNLKEFNKIQKNENNYYRTRLGDNLVTVRKNLEVFVEQGLNSVENFNFKDKENKLFDKGIPFENISIEQRQALSKQNIIYPANIINKTDLPIEIKNYVNLYNQYISLNSSNRANFATNRSVINENTVLYLDSANKLNYIMAASDLASLEESEVHSNNYLSIALAQRGEQEDVNISESVSDNPVYAKRIKELKTELKELVDKRGRVLPGKERQYDNAKKHLAFLEQSVYDQMKSAIILFLQENKIKVNYSLANSLYEIAIKSDTTADFHEKMQDRFSNDIKLPFAFSYFDSWGMSISELMKKEYNRINTESKKFDGKDDIYIERTHRAKDFNNYIRKNGDRQTKYIWKLIKNVAFKINPKIKFVFEENFRDITYAEAFTQDQTNFKDTRIEIRASLLQNPKWAAATLVHEIIHSIAHNIIDIVVFNEKKQIHLLTERQINAVKELTKLIKEVQANDKTNKFYGATDAHELLSELTDKEFVEALKEKAPNIFRRIQNFFLNILGIEKNKYRRAEAILKDIISKPVHITEIGNTIYPGLFPQKTFYKNDFLESVADSNLKLPIDLKQFTEVFAEGNKIKKGVQELFESNPELANAVYEVLGFKSLNMDSFMPKKHWQIGHIIDNPTEAANICDNTQIRVLNYVLDKFGKAKERGTFYAKPVAIWAKSPINDKQILHYTVAVRINNKVYLYDMPQSEYIEYVSENKGKIIKEYKPRLIEYTPDSLKKYYGTSDENLTIQDETILTDALININLSTPQQKQKAQQIYSQYLDSLNKSSTNPILQGNQKPDVILPIGTSGSGKSTFIKSLSQENLVVIEPDAMRVEFTGNMNDKSKDKEIYEEAASRAIKAIKQGKQVVFDTTNLTKDKRLPFIETIKKAIPNANIQYKLMELNPELAKQRIKAQLARGENRAAVSDETIDRHAASYKQMLEDIKDEPISNFDVLQEQIKKFQELQERLNNKEFIEGTKNTYKSSKGLQEWGTQEQYNDYIARVSLGIVKNPSSGEYNYTSKVKDIVYHYTDADRFENFIKDYIGSSVQRTGVNATDSELGIFFGNKNLEGVVNKEKLGKTEIPAIINITKENTDIYEKAEDYLYSTDRFIDEQEEDYDIDTEEDENGNIKVVYKAKEKITGKDFERQYYNSLKSDLIAQGVNGIITDNIKVVFEPEQIHILGSKQDIEGFKEFVQKDNSSEINSSVSDDIDFNRESNRPNISESISDNVNTQEGLNLTKSITVDETTNTVNINDILVNGTTTIKATSEFTIEGISDSNIETLIIEAPSVNVNTENFNVETLIIKTESQTSFPDINISQNSNIESLQIQNSNTNLEITDLTSENNLVFKNFVSADKNDCFLDNFTETSGFTINSAEPFKYSLNFDNSKNLTILQTNELKEIPVSIRNIENLTLEEDVEINIVSMQTTALNLNVNENNIIRLEKKYEKAAINIQAEEPTNITLHGKTRVNLDFKDKFVSINNNVSLTKDSDISFQEEAWSETEKFQEQQEKVLEKQYDSVEEYIDNDDPFDLKTSIDSYISEFNSINTELKKTAKIVQVEADSHAIYRENHTTTLTISESVADILEDRSPYIKVSEEEATNALMSSLNPASFLTVNEQLLATSVLDIDIDHLANKIISGLIYINVNSVGMNVRTLFDNLTHLKEQFKDEKVILENLKKLDSKLNEKYAELKVRIQKDSVTYSERVHKALEDTVLDENEETQQKRVLELSRKKLNAFYTEQVNTLYKQLKEVTKQIELLLQEDTSAEFRVPAALKIKLQEKITDLKDQRLRVRNLRAEDIVSEFTISLSNLTPLLDSYTEFIKFLEDNKEEINSVTLTHTIDKTIQDLVIALGQEQSKMETAKLLAFKDGKKVPETALDAYTSEMLKSLAGRVQLLATRTSALARQSFFKYAAEVLNVDVADIAREIKALQDNGLPDTHILDEWFFDPTKGLFMPDKAGLFPSLMQMTLDSEINAWRSYAIRLSTDLNNVQEEGDKALKKIRINGRKMNALDFKARNKYGRYTKHFIDVYNEDYIQNYKAVWRTLNELLKVKLDTPEKKNKSLKPFIDQIANQYEVVNIFKLSAFADLKGKRLPVYMDIDFQVDAEYEQSLKDKYGEEVFNYLVEQSKEKLLNTIQNWEYDFKSVAVANNVESFAELQAKNPEAANTLLEKLKDRLPLPSDFKDASYVAKTKLFVKSFTVPTSTKVFNKFFIDNVLGNETIRKYYTALKNLENYIINQKNELDNVSYAAPLVKYKTFLEHFTDNRENHSFLMKTSAAFRSLFKDVNKLWFKTYKVPGEVTGIATQESLSIIPKAVPSNFYKNQMAIKKIAEAANSAVLTKKIPATSDSFVHFIFEKVANLPFVKGVTTVEDLMTEFNEIRANYVRISDAQNAVINSLLTHLEYEKSSTDLAETLKAHLLIINMATSRNMAQGKINILLKYFQDIKKTIKQKGTTTVSDRVRAKALSAVQTWYDKNIIGANLEADPDSAGKLRLGKEDRELLEYLRKEGILTEKESKEIQPFFTYKKLSAGAIVTAFLKYTIWKGLGWNLKSGSTNFMQGMFDDFIAGASGKYYTADYYYKALRMLPQSMFKFFTFSHKLVPKALRRNLENSDAIKFRRLMDKFKVLQDSSNLLQQAGKNEKFLNTQKLGAFHWQKSIEYLNQGVLILGEIYSRDIQIDENTKVKLWDLFDQQGNLKEEYASNKELYINWQLGRGKQFNAFTSKVNKMIVEVHGDYQETRGFKASHSEVGRALILFKKFFPQQVANRWSKKQTVYELGEDTMGRTEDSLDKMQTIGRYRALTPSAAALVGAANIRTSLSAALLRPIFGNRLKPLLSIADAVISPWLLPATAIGAVIGATWAIAAKLYNGKQKGAKIFGDMPQVLGRTLYGFITTPVNVLAGRELLKNTYSNKSLSALENLAMNESLNDVRITLFMTMLSMLIRWKLHRDPNDDGADDEESTTDQVLLAILNRIDANLAEHTQYTDPLSMLQFLDLTESSPANTLAQMINMPIKVQKQMERIEKMTEIEKYFLTDSDYDRASYWVGFKETFLPSPARKYWGWSSSMNFDFTTEIKTREVKQFVPALYHPIEWLTTTKEQREEKEMEARILNIKNAYKKEFKNLYFDYFQSLDESEKNEFADELKEIIDKAMVKPKYLDNEQTLSFFENESMLRAKVNLSIKKFYFTDRFKQQQVKIKNNKEAQAAYNAVIKLFEKQKNDDLYKINGGAILNYSTKYKIYKKEIINRERELKEALNRAGINYIAPKAVEKVAI